jgi:hypothetical protein
LAALASSEGILATTASRTKDKVSRLIVRAIWGGPPEIIFSMTGLYAFNCFGSTGSARIRLPVAA